VAETDERPGGSLDASVSRRSLIRAGTGVVGIGTAAAAASPASAQSDDPDFGGWFDKTDNYDGVVDETGADEVTVEVGASGNKGNLAFAPPAIRVDPGTTVVWEWTGEGGAHNVVAPDGAFDSGDPVLEAGTTFEQAFDSGGEFRYICEPHEAQGMVGVVLVGDASPGGGGGGADGGGADDGSSFVPTVGDGPWTELFAVTLFGMLAAPVAYHFVREQRHGGVPASQRGRVLEATGEDDEHVETIDHDSFDPTGTLSLVLLYMAILVVMWIVMYFIEFLGGPTVVG
jgi:halocyanin-like protein